MANLDSEWWSHPTGNQGDVGSNPAQRIKRFSSNENVIQKLSDLGPFLTTLQFISLGRDLDCESTCDPPGGRDALLARETF